MAASADIDFSAMTTMPKVWPTPAGAPVEVTGTARFAIKRGRLRFAARSFWESLLYFFNPGGAAYFNLPTLDNPITEIGVEFNWTAEGRNSSGGALNISVGDRKFYGANGAHNIQGGMHLGILRDHLELTSVTTGPVFLNKQIIPISPPMGFGTLFTVRALIDHTTGTLTIEHPRGTAVFEDWPNLELSKNDGFVECFSFNMSKDPYGDIKHFWATSV